MSEKERLNYFLTVAKLGGVKPASELLGINTAQLFRKIHSLEEEYNAKFFSRNYRGLDLTEEGKKFFDVAQRILTELSEFEASIKHEVIENSQSTTLKIASSIGIVSEWIAPNIPDFLSMHENINITVNVEMRAFNLDAIDLCLSTKIPERDDLIQKKIRTYTFKLYASKSYIERYGRPKSLMDLDKHKLIFFAGEDRLLIREPENLFQLESHGKIRTPTIIINSPVAELQVMTRGGGIACVTTDWPEIQDENIIDLFPEVEKKIDIYAIYKKENKNSLVAPFIDFLLEKK